MAGGLERSGLRVPQQPLQGVALQVATPADGEQRVVRHPHGTFRAGVPGRLKWHEVALGLGVGDPGGVIQQPARRFDVQVHLGQEPALLLGDGAARARLLRLPA